MRPGIIVDVTTADRDRLEVGYNQSHTGEDLTASRLSPATTIDGGLLELGNMHAGLSGWQYVRSDQAHSGNRLRGKGTDFILGLSDGNWSVNTYVSVSRPEQHSSWKSSGDYNLDGGISLTSSGEGLPRVIIALSYDAAHQGVDAHSRSMTTSVALDFAKYLGLHQPINYLDGAKVGKLQLSYAAKIASPEGYVPVSPKSTTDHYIGAMIEIRGN